MRRLAGRIGHHRFLGLLRVYPPYLGAGVRVRSVARDLSRVEVEMRLLPWNQNFLGTQFGGSLYSMCDPFFALMLMMRLGPDYTVWDKAARIEFRRPGRGTVRAVFELPDARLREIRDEVDRAGRHAPVFEVAVVDEGGETVARVEKVLSVRRGAMRSRGEPRTERG